MAKKNVVSIINASKAMKTWNNQQKQLANVGNSMSAKETAYMNDAYRTQQMSNAFNASQAQLNRDFQERMSSTAHQREVQDLIAAGLSPVLSANAGATTPGGAMAQTSDNITAAFGTLANSALNAMSNITQAMANNSTQVLGMAANQQISKYAADLSSRTQMSITQANNQMQAYVARLNSFTSQEVARIAANANVDAALINQLTSKYSAELAYDASVYGTNRSSLASERNTIRNNSATIKATKMNNETSDRNTITAGILGILGGLTGALGRG